ncbi:hypothetical protein IscW_ISCW001249 [Ixodes scapularis]|uniref:Uncharacterized protein n=1 Tax=Ixodes scapularis TaxID=6945 RepID=B7P600_IXOSC|nr:hypothetical protein IscW_ISCW001249 [Ixodes scapularis]|eukprot:XP_002408142.1 hypothetical protein IscW_ISCW001249 [Ixodes scapularis]
MKFPATNSTTTWYTHSLTAVFICLFLLTAGEQSLLWKTWLYGSIFGYSWFGMNSVA